MTRDKVVDGTAQRPNLAFLLLHLASKTLLLVHTKRRSLARLYPYYAAKASVSVRRSNNARGISTISGCAGDIKESVTGQSCLRAKASVSANVGRALIYQAV